jgi:hypothetical protein
MLIAAAVLGVVWIGVIAVVAGLCASAAHGDRALASYTLPRRATWRTVRSSSFRSAQSDQLAT